MLHKFLLRIPEPLWSQLVDCARTNRRSINGEILWRLTRSIEGYTK